MKPFKSGDRVVCIHDYENGGWLGFKGIVVKNIYGDSNISVDFGKKSSNGHGHNVSGSISTKTGWNFPYAYLKHAEVQLEFDF